MISMIKWGIVLAGLSVAVRTQNSGPLSREWPQVGHTSVRQASEEHGFVDQKEPEDAISSLTLAWGAFALSTSIELSQRETAWQLWTVGAQQWPRFVARVWVRDVIPRGPPALPESSLMQMKFTRWLSVSKTFVSHQSCKELGNSSTVDIWDADWFRDKENQITRATQMTGRAAGPRTWAPTLSLGSIPWRPAAWLGCLGPQIQLPYVLVMFYMGMTLTTLVFLGFRAHPQPSVGWMKQVESGSTSSLLSLIFFLSW